MKRNITSLLLTIIMLFSFSPCIYSHASSATDEVVRESSEIIYLYESAVNEHNVDKYISLFAKNIQEEMRNHCLFAGNEKFFAEEDVDILSLNINKDYSDAALVSRFEDTIYFDVEMQVRYSKSIDRATCVLKEGYNKMLFSLVKEDGKWRLYCISSRNNLDNGNRSLSCPSSTVIYFTQTNNLAHWNVTSMNLSWDHYLKNVLPNEWYIYWYVYNSDYSEASSMASKMYSWYFTVNPRWDFAPYYSCMKDNTDDHVYVYNSYSNLAQVYKTATDNAMSYLSNKALTRSNGTIFEVHYNGAAHSQNSGWMCVSECLTKAQNGVSSFNILSYYYSYSSYNNGPIQITTY